LSELNTFGRSQGLFGFEVAKNIYFVLDGFAGKGILTNTMKLIRYEARTYFKTQIDEMYAEG
jgi:long-subunit acyl-CoA synthetase (AMP-forming)